MCTYICDRPRANPATPLGLNALMVAVFTAMRNVMVTMIVETGVMSVTVIAI